MWESCLRAVKWIIFCLAVIGLAWRIVILNMAEHFAEHSDAAPEVALSWYDRHPNALFNQAFTLLESDPVSAEHLLLQLIWENPADGRAYVALAGLWEKSVPEKAGELVRFGEKMDPIRFTTRLSAADFWLKRGELEKALQAWNVALELRADIRKEFYPLLLQFADNPSTRLFFKKLVDNPPSWWSHFFDYAARNAQQLDTLRTLYSWRQLSETEIEAGDRQALMKRLEKENRWQESYFVWINSFNETQLQELGNIYNGSFELPLSNEGFGWRIFNRSGINIKTNYTYGIKGGKALHIAFTGQRVLFRHVLQYLFLTPGNYQLQGLVRPEGLRLARGLQWKLRCLKYTDVLGNSERFLGSSQWRSFNISFQIPEQNCRIQQLRLEMVSEQAYAIKGSIWFDDLRIKRHQEEQ